MTKQATTSYLKLLIDCSPQGHRFYQLSTILWNPRLKNFNDFHVQRNELEGISKDHAIPAANDSVGCSHLFSQFEIFSCDMVKQIIRSLLSKSCSLDPVPTHILKNHLDAIGPVNSYCQQISNLW